MKSNLSMQRLCPRRFGPFIGVAIVGLTTLPAWLSEASTAERRPVIRITWTDTGVYVGQRPKHLDDHNRFMFQPFAGAVTPLKADVPRAGQILIPMPDNDRLPKTQQQWDRFRVQLEQGLSARLERGLSQGVTDFEIRTVENINITGGYWAPWQQARVVQFGQTFLEALGNVREPLARRGPVEIRGLVGSNGGFLATESIARLGTSPLDHLTIVDGRAYVDRTLSTARIMQGKLTLVNTGGDAWALTDMVAHHGGAKALKGADPRIHVIYLDPQGWNFPAGAHIAAMTMDRNRPVVAKEFLGNGYSEPVKTTIGNVRDFLLSGEPPEQLNGVSLQMQISEASFAPDSSGQSRALKDALLKPRSGNDALAWPAGEAKP
ncbi:MAG: hypothetical protein HY735_28690 [Verrucomicrobia bacterium]|nr:hypothetical protein [Verrucomicrobiota bacterium]